MIAATAHQIAADPELFYRVVLIGKHEWECMGYSRTGRTVRFARLVELPDSTGNAWKIKQVNIYVNPDKEVKLR